MAVTSIKTGTSLKLKYSLVLNEKGVEIVITVYSTHVETMEPTTKDIFGLIEHQEGW